MGIWPIVFFKMQISLNEWCLAFFVGLVIFNGCLVVANEGLEGSSTKNVKILVVTITGKGANPNYRYHTLCWSSYSLIRGGCSPKLEK